MTFIWPVMLFSLVLIPLLIAIYVTMQQRRKELSANFNRLGLSTAGKNGQNIGFRRHVPPIFFMFGLTLLAVALARPQAVVSLPKQQGTVILAFDVSGSMAADDLKPTRMEAAKTAALDFIKNQPVYVQIGVVAFSDNGLTVQVPTTDSSAIQSAIARLAPQSGTSLAQGIQASLNTISASNTDLPAEVYSNLLLTPGPTPTPVPAGTHIPAVIILLSDGENNEQPSPITAAQIAANQGVRIYTVGIGSPTGTTVHINGFSLHTQLNQDLLQQIAQLTGGAYYNAQSTQQLISIYDHLDTQLTNKPEMTEITALFAGASIFLLLVGGMLSLLWFSRLP